MRIMQVHTPAGGHLCYHIRGHPLRRRPTERKTELSEREREGVGKRERESPPDGRAFELLDPVMTESLSNP